MKRGTKILLVLFVIAAVTLYVINYVIPKTHGMMVKTVIVEYGELPISDSVKMILVRDETLFSAAETGSSKYLVKEGTKVRNSVKIIEIEPGASAPTSAAINKVKKAAGSKMKVSDNGMAAFSAIVSFYSDGLERKFRSDRIPKMKESMLDSLDADATPLKRDDVNEGEPVYKLVDNTLWQMVYWIPADSDFLSYYEIDKRVKVMFQTRTIDVKVEDLHEKGELVRVVLQTDIYYEEFAKKRIAEAEVVFSNYTGLIAPAMSVMARDGQDGVFVRQKSGSFKWIPVNVEKTVDDKCILTPVTYIDEEGIKIPTVNYYDELLADPKAEGYK